MRRAAAVSFVVLAGGIAAACSSGTSSSSTTTTSGASTTSTSARTSSACRTARTRFQEWIDATAAAIDAGNSASGAWVTFVNSFDTLLPPSQTALETAVSQFDANNQKAQAQRQAATQALGAYQAALATCAVSGLPAACQSEFAHHQAGITAATALQTADQTDVGMIQTEQQAMRAGNSSGVSAAEHAYNAAVDSYNTTVHTWNTWRDAEDSLEVQCDSAISA